MDKKGRSGCEVDQGWNQTLRKDERAGCKDGMIVCYGVGRT